MIGTTCLHRIIWTLVYITYLTVQIYMRVLSVGVIESLGWTSVIMKILIFKVQFHLPVYQVLSLLVLTFIHTPITNINVHQQYSKLVPNLLRRQFHVRKTICCLCKYKSSHIYIVTVSESNQIYFSIDWITSASVQATIENLHTDKCASIVINIAECK